MLNTIFADLCADEPVVGEDVWECSRFTIAPLGLSGPEMMRVSQYLAVAHVEFALLNNIRRYTMIGEMHRVPTLCAMGWKVRPLSLPTECEGKKILSLEVSIDEDTLPMMHSRFGIDGPVLETSPAAVAS